jgi:hypothetical protein
VVFDGYRLRLRNVINVSRWETDLCKPVCNVDFFHCVCPVIHASRDANDNAVFGEVKQRIFSEPDQTCMVAGEPGDRAR